jgi:hypothetical protein
MRGAALTLAVALLLIVAGCTGAPTNERTDRSPSSDDGPTGTTPDTPETTSHGTETTAGSVGPNHPPDPDADRVGWENGDWYNETLAVTSDDGYNETEREQLLARTMARVEVIRGLEFRRNVTVEVITREEYRENNVFEQDPDPFQDQAYEATFLVDEDTSAAEAFDEVYSGSIAGYYYNDQIVLVSNDPQDVDVSRSTLAHELVHAIQDQHELYAPRGARTTDRSNAATALSEGEANNVMDRYERRCETEWQCIPPADRADSERPYNFGLFLTLFVPYSEGPEYVADLYDRGGWEDVEAAYDDPPESTEQVIHPEKYPDEDPVDVDVEDRSSGEWSEVVGRQGSSDTLGEAVLYAMFQHNGVIEEDQLRENHARFNYSHSATEGWDGDSVVAYENDGEFGYVFETVWDTERDAREFHEAYLDLLENRGANQVRDGVYRIPEGEPFADAFRVERDGRTVVITNAPTVEDLEDVRSPDEG